MGYAGADGERGFGGEAGGGAVELEGLRHAGASERLDTVGGFEDDAFGRGAQGGGGLGEATGGGVGSIERDLAPIAFGGGDESGGAKQERVLVFFDDARGKAGDDDRGGVDAIGNAFEAQLLVAGLKRDAAGFRDEGEAAEIAKLDAAFIALGIAVDGDRQVERGAGGGDLRMHRRRLRDQAGEEQPAEARRTHGAPQ